MYFHSSVVRSVHMSFQKYTEAALFNVNYTI